VDVPGNSTWVGSEVEEGEEKKEARAMMDSKVSVSACLLLPRD
jgi:hypothetical protein